MLAPNRKRICLLKPYDFSLACDNHMSCFLMHLTSLSSKLRSLPLRTSGSLVPFYAASYPAGKTNVKTLCRSYLYRFTTTNYNICIDKNIQIDHTLYNNCLVKIELVVPNYNTVKFSYIITQKLTLITVSQKCREVPSWNRTVNSKFFPKRWILNTSWKPNFNFSQKSKLHCCQKIELK